MEKKQTRFHWGWRIALIYTTFALATIGFMIFSFTQKVDLVSTQYYADELKYDAKMLAEKNTIILSEWIAKIEWKSDNTTFYAEQRFTK